MRKWRWISSLRDLQLITERVKGRKKYGTILKCLETLLNFHSMVKYIYSRVMVLGIDRVKNSFSHLLVLCDPVFERSTNDYRKIVRHLLKIAPKFYLRIGTFRSLFVYLVKKKSFHVFRIWNLGTFSSVGEICPGWDFPQSIVIYKSLDIYKL